MQRDAEKELRQWADSEARSPLLIRGPRQVGKTYLVEHFAQDYFDHYVTVNFEFQPSCLQCFESFDPSTIVRSLQIVTGQSIQPGKTLLFLDEIQECPRAISALRYFKEQMPELAIIGAGSLLEFVMEEHNFKMPVGRVAFLYLYPLNFMEFLSWTGNKHLRDHLQQLDKIEPLPKPIHQKAYQLLEQYCYIGGMPEIVAHYQQAPEDWPTIAMLQNKLLQGYTYDFGKYTRTQKQYQYLKIAFERLPSLVTTLVKYSKIDSEAATRDIKQALNKIHQAGLCQWVYDTKGVGIPLQAHINHKRFKLLFLDVGLYLRALRLDPALAREHSVVLSNKGTLAEQLVGQELLSSQSRYEIPQVYYWHRDKKGSQAEVDYLYQYQQFIIPLEVKAGRTGRIRSLQQFKQLYESPIAVRLSTDNIHWHKQDILSIPLYLVSQLQRLVGAEL